jgi:hypothetical protein
VDEPPPNPPSPSPVPDTGDPAFEALWGRVLSAWNDDKTHAALLEYALTAQRLPDAAGRYRALQDDAEKGERARKRLDLIVLAATQMMLAMKSPPQTKVPLPITLSALGIFLCAAAFLIYAILRH